MSASRTFSSPRTTVPDTAALLTSLRTALGDATAGIALTADGVLVKKATAWLAGDITAAQNAIDSATAMTPQRVAQNAIDGWPIVERALVLALIDEINVLRTEINTLRAAVTPPLTPPLTQRTPAQAIAAVRAKAGTL